jgi:diadenosine tetraphosphate (Ap4A) HIT family hydrolase
MLDEDCPFCALREEPFYEGREIVGLWPLYPVTPGHALLVTRRHVVDWFAASSSEQAELTQSISLVRAMIEREHRPLGYNIGLNCGGAAGQTVFHLHLHIVPRYGEPPSDDIEIRMITPSAEKHRKWQESL